MMLKQVVEFITPVTIKIWLVISLITIIDKGIVSGWEDKPADFYNYYTASKLLIKNTPINKLYDSHWFNDQAQLMGINQGAKFSPFPPITAFLFLPLTTYEPLTAKRIWLIINILALLIIPLRIKKITKWPYKRIILFISLFTFPITSCLHLGQTYLIIGFLLLEVFGQIYFKNMPKFIGVIIGILTSLKYVPILFLGYIINYRKRYTIFIWFFLGITIPTVLIFYTDSKSFSTFFSHLQSHLQGNIPGQGQYAVGFQSIDSLLNNLFVFNSIENPSPFINRPILKPIIKSILLGSIIFTQFILLKKSRYEITPLFTSICIIALFIMLPATASYHFLLLILPLLYIFKWLFNFGSKKDIGIIMMLVFITFSIQIHHIPTIYQSYTLNLLLHYPRLWGLLFLFLLNSVFYSKYLSKKYG